MKAKQLYYLLVVTCCVVIGSLFAVAYGANRLLGQQAQKLSRLRADSQAAELQQSSLLKDKRDIAKYSELNTIAESVVPQDKDQAAAVRQIVNIAAASGISNLSSITFPASTLGVTTSGAAKPNLTQLIPVPGISGVDNLQITITQSVSDSVSYSDFLAFLTGLEQNRRTAEVTSITVEPDAKQPNNVSFTLIVNEFHKAMKNGDIKLNFGNVGAGLGAVLKQLNAYRALIFFLMVASLYGYIVWRINTYSNAPPSQSEESSQLAAQPHIDQSTVQKMQELQNNSVSVQSLFNQARQNPFQE